MARTDRSAIQRTLDHGPHIGAATGMGATVADALYGAIGAFGVTAIIVLLTEARPWLALAGTLFLLWLAWGAWNGAGSTHAAAARGCVSAWRAIAGTLVLTLSNPATILAFIAVFSSLALGVSTASPAWMVAGVFLGSAAWWCLLVAIFGCMRKRLRPMHLLWIRRSSAVLLAGFAGYQLLSLIAL